VRNSVGGRRLISNFGVDRFSERTVVAGAEPGASRLRSHLRGRGVGDDFTGLRALEG
jgi:hypothetical protein